MTKFSSQVEERISIFVLEELEEEKKNEIDLQQNLPGKRRHHVMNVYEPKANLDRRIQLLSKPKEIRIF